MHKKLNSTYINQNQSQLCKNYKNRNQSKAEPCFFSCGRCGKSVEKARMIQKSKKVDKKEKKSIDKRQEI